MIERLIIIVAYALAGLAGGLIVSFLVALQYENNLGLDLRSQPIWRSPYWLSPRNVYVIFLAVIACSVLGYVRKRTPLTHRRVSVVAGVFVILSGCLFGGVAWVEHRAASLTVLKHQLQIESSSMTLSVIEARDGRILRQEKGLTDFPTISKGKIIYNGYSDPLRYPFQDFQVVTSRTGALLWKTPSPPVPWQVIVDERLMYLFFRLPTDAYRITAVEGNSGKQVWSHNFKLDIPAGVLLGKNKLWIHSGDQPLWGLDKQSGAKDVRLAWPLESGLPVLAHSNLWLSSGYESVVAFEPDTDVQQWKYEPEDASEQNYLLDPLLNKNQVCLPTRAGRIVLLDLISGDEIAVIDTGEQIYASDRVAFDENGVYYIDSQSVVHAMDWNQRILWQRKFASAHRLIYPDGGGVLCVVDKNKVRGLELSTGNERWHSEYSDPTGIASIWSDQSLIFFLHQ